MLRPLSIFAALLVVSTASTRLGFGQRFDDHQKVASSGDLSLTPTAPVEAVNLAVAPEPGSVAIFTFALAVLGVARVARLRDET